MVKNQFILAILSLISFYSFEVFPQRSDYHYLLDPIGSISLAMGETGTALVNDESVLFFNPAGLAFQSNKFRELVGSIQCGPIMPVFHFNDFWQGILTCNYRDPSFLFQPGLFINTFNLGELQKNTIALGMGINPKLLGLRNHYFGLSVKYISEDAIEYKNYTDYIDHSSFFKMDVGYLWNIGNGLCFGSAFSNMGSGIHFDKMDTTMFSPFTINIALGYNKPIVSKKFHLTNFSTEVRLDRKVDTSFEINFHKITEHVGFQATFENDLNVRGGFIQNIFENNFELYWGIGYHFMKHYSINFSKIIAPQGFMREYSRLFNSVHDGSSGHRDTQWRLSFIYKWQKI